MTVRNLGLISFQFENEAQFRESCRIVLNGLKRPPQTSREMYMWTYALTGDPVPHKAVCPGHASPWAMFWEAYRRDLHPNAPEVIVVVGPRDGLKTRTLSKLNVAEMLLKPRCEICFVAAVDGQASRSTKYMKAYLAHPAVAETVRKAITRHVELVNGSHYEQLVGGLNAVNSPHPQKVRADEVELVKPREILEDMKLMPSSYNGILKSQIYCSTRKFLKGNMDWLTGDGRPSNAKTLVWCYKEVAEKCPDERSGTIKAQYEVPDLMHPGDTLVVDAYDRCGECKLLPSCRGDLKRAAGTTSIDDLIDSYSKLSRQAWLVQKECVEPMQTDRFFSDWDGAKQVGDYKFNPSLPVDVIMDYSGGSDDPTSVGYWQRKGEDQYRIGEQIFHRKPTTVVSVAIETWCNERGIVPRYMRGDSANAQFIRDLKNSSRFFKNLSAVKKIGRNEGWIVCKAKVKDANGVRHLFVDKSCRNFINEIENAVPKDSDPDDLNGEDHSLDEWRYYTVEFFMKNREPRVRWLDPYQHTQGAKAGTAPQIPAAEKPSLPSKIVESDISASVNRFLNED